MAAPVSQATRLGITSAKSAASVLSSTPTETTPITSPEESRTGTLARSDDPRVPVSVPTNSPPARATLGSVETFFPISDGSGCE